MDWKGRRQLRGHEYISIVEDFSQWVDFLHRLCCDESASFSRFVSSVSVGFFKRDEREFGDEFYLFLRVGMILANVHVARDVIPGELWVIRLACRVWLCLC